MRKDHVGSGMGTVSLVPERSAIEDEHCHQNNIVSDNINYFAESSIVSNGQKTLVDNNMLEKDKPHLGRSSQEMLQSFETRLTRDLIDDLRQITQNG